VGGREGDRNNVSFPEKRREILKFNTKFHASSILYCSLLCKRLTFRSLQILNIIILQGWDRSLIWRHAAFKVNNFILLHIYWLQSNFCITQTFKGQLNLCPYLSWIIMERFCLSKSLCYTVREKNKRTGICTHAIAMETYRFQLLFNRQRRRLQKCFCVNKIIVCGECVIWFELTIFSHSLAVTIGVKKAGHFSRREVNS
jgi:hypothetical protein